MSIFFAGVTFAKQHLSWEDDAILRRRIVSDGSLTGCEVSISGSTLSMSAGHLLACGRQAEHTAPQSWTLPGSGFARLLLVIDMTGESAPGSFSQVDTVLQTASSAEGFPELVQEDVNNGGSRYEMILAMVDAGRGEILAQIDHVEGI